MDDAKDFRTLTVCVCVCVLDLLAPIHTFFFIWAHLLQDALTVLGVDAQEQDAIFQVMAAILHLGNVQVGYPPPIVCLVVVRPLVAGTTPDCPLSRSVVCQFCKRRGTAAKGTMVASQEGRPAPHILFSLLQHGCGGPWLTLLGLADLRLAAELLGHRAEELERVLCSRTMGSASRKSIYVIPLSPDEVPAPHRTAPHRTKSLSLSHCHVWCDRRVSRAMCCRRPCTRPSSIGW